MLRIQPDQRVSLDRVPVINEVTSAVGDELVASHGMAASGSVRFDRPLEKHGCSFVRVWDPLIRGADLLVYSVGRIVLTPGWILEAHVISDA